MAKRRVVTKKTIATVAAPVETSVETKTRSSKKSYFVGVIFVILVLLGYAGYKQLVVATVNGEMISRLTVVKELEKQGGQKTLDTIIIKTLIAQEAKKEKIVVTQKDVDDEMVKVEANVAAQGGTLDQLLQQQGMTKADLLDELKLQLMVTKMVDKGITVSDKDIDGYLASQKAQTTSSPDASPAPEMPRDQAAAQVKQEKLSAKIQAFISDLKTKAKINYMISY